MIEGKIVYIPPTKPTLIIDCKIPLNDPALLEELIRILEASKELLK